MKIIGKLCKYTFVGLIIAVFVLFFYRVSMMKDPAEMLDILPSDASKSVYVQNGDLVVKTQEIVNKTISSDGKFYTTGLMILPETNELIITVRYLDSTLDSLAEAYSLDSVDPLEEYFEFSLVSTTDKDMRIYPTETVTMRKWKYTYYRMRFEGVDISKYEDLAVAAYYLGDLDYSKQPFGSVFAYHPGWNPIDYDLTSRDRKLLSE